MNVDEWLEEADYLDPKDVPRSTSSLSVHTDASGTGVSTPTRDELSEKCRNHVDVAKILAQLLRLY